MAQKLWASPCVYRDMRIHTALAALFVLTASLIQAPAHAEADTRAHLRLLVVDQANAALPAATVTLFTMDGNPGVTATADEYGVAVFPDLPVGVAQIYARLTGYGPYIEGTTLRGGSNAQTVTLHSRKHGRQTASPSKGVSRS
jgi:hypothetical protein